MKKLLPILLAGMFLFCGCTADTPTPTTVPSQPVQVTTAPPETEAPTTEAPTEATVPPTTLPPVGELSMNTKDITFRKYNDRWEVYNGTMPKQYVTFSSDNETVVTFVDGIVTAIGPGTAYVHAEYEGETVSCIIRCVFEAPDLSRDPVKAPPESFEGASAYFHDAVFVGDSVSMQLSYYAAETGLLGNAQFLVRGSYSVAHAVNSTMLMPFQEEEIELPDAIAATGAKKVFFLLGTNDIALHGIEKTMENWKTLIARIRANQPDLEIFLQSMPPVWTGGEKGGLNNPNINRYNEALASFAKENNCTYIDISSYLKDATGGLATVYCIDRYVHLTEEGADVWIKVLKAFAGY